MNQFTEIHIDGFRRLCGIKLPLKPLNVVIGANGVGKTSLLDVFDLLRASAEGNLAEKVSDLQGFDALITRDGRDSFSVGFLANYRSERLLCYELVLHASGAGGHVQSETLYEVTSNASVGKTYLRQTESDLFYFDDDLGDLRRHELWNQPLTTALSFQPMEDQSMEPWEIRVLARSCIHYGALDVGERSPVRVPQPLRPTDTPGENGQYLISCLYLMRESFPDRFETIQDTLRAAFPKFQRLGFPAVAAGTLSMTWHDESFTEPMYPHQLSEGTLRFLWLVTLLQSPGLPAVTLIDEPEVSLHPELLSLLAELFREASTRTQLIVATQSDSLIRFLKPEEVVVMDIGENGLATATRADSFDLDAWLKDYTLDEVWRMGQMGGKAW